MTSRGAGGDDRRVHDRIRTGVIVLNAVLLVLLVVLVVMLVRLSRDGGDEGPAPVVAGDGSAELVPADAPRAPARLPDPGAFVEAAVQPDGSVEVRHWLRPADSVARLAVRPYPTRQVPGPPSVTDLTVRTDLGEVRLTEEFTAGTAPVAVTLVRPSRLVVLTYTLDGVTGDDGSVAGRVLVDSVLADVDYAAERGGTRVELAGRSILQLACSPEDGDLADQRACGAQRDGGWTVDLTPGQLDDRVLAQVDLDPAERADTGTARFARGGFETLAALAPQPPGRSVRAGWFRDARCARS